MTDRSFESRAGPVGDQSAPLDVSVRSEGTFAWVIEVGGELDHATGPILKQHVRRYKVPNSANGQPSRIVYVLRELVFMDVSGLNALLGAANGHSPEVITIREPTSSVRRLLELVGLDSMIEERADR